jgi:hypothetical protein
VELFLPFCTLLYGVTRDFIWYFLKIYAGVIFMCAEGIMKLHDSFCIQTCGTVKKNNCDLLYCGYLGGGVYFDLYINPGNGDKPT